MSNVYIFKSLPLKASSFCFVARKIKFTFTMNTLKFILCKITEWSVRPFLIALHCPSIHHSDQCKLSLHHYHSAIVNVAQYICCFMYCSC